MTFLTFTFSVYVLDNKTVKLTVKLLKTRLKLK